MDSSSLPVVSVRTCSLRELIGQITHYQENIHEQHLPALKNILTNRKCRIEEDEKAEQQLALTTSGSWQPEHTSWVTNAPGRISQIEEIVQVFKKNCANREGDLFSKCAQIGHKAGFSTIQEECFP